MKVIATYNIKGGVGKTSAAVNLAWLSAAGGLRTLVWDLDPQAAATYLFRVKPKVKGGARRLVRGRSDVDDHIKGTDFDRLDLLPADFSYRTLDLALDDTKKPTRRLARILQPLADEYDVIVLDCPPSISLVSESVIRAADLLLVPLIPSALSLRTFDQLQDFLAQLTYRPPQVLAFFSMVDRRRRLHRDVIDRLPRERPAVSRIGIPAASAVEQMGERRSPVVAWLPDSAASHAYRALWTRTGESLRLLSRGQ